MLPSMPGPSWFVGCGNMGGAMVAGWVAAHRDLSAMTAISPSGRDIPGIEVANTYPDEEPSWIWLGHKPYQVEEVARKLGPRLSNDTILISILGGVECSSLRRLFPKVRSVVRAMPNLPVSDGEGVVGLYSDDADDAQRSEIGSVISDLGLAAWVEHEEDLVAVSTVAGSGPAYVARFADALAKQAKALGLDPDLALEIALQTIAGTGHMARASGEAMDRLACRVASPGGSTEAGLEILDGPDGIEALVSRTVEAARKRTEEMAVQARG